MYIFRIRTQCAKIQVKQSHKVHFKMRMEQKDLKCCQLTLCPTCHPKIAKVTQNSPMMAAAAAFTNSNGRFPLPRRKRQRKKIF